MTHVFFSKAYRNRLVIPNKIVVQSRPDDSEFYSGEATDAESYALLPRTEFYETYLESNEQAGKIASAILSKSQLWSDAGALNVPMNVAQEAYDYIKATDSREGDTRIGNIGTLTRRYIATKNRWETNFSFGNWQTVRKALADLGITGDDLENYFSRLQVGDLYAEHILAENVDFVWIDPDNTIDLSKIGDNLDNLPDGEYYYRARKMHLDGETGLTLWEGMRYYIRFSTDSDEAGIRRQDSAPSGVEAGEYWIDTSGEEPIIKRWTGSTWFTIEQWEIDALNQGVLTAHTKLASLSVDGLVLLDQVAIGETYNLVYASSISAHQILLSKTEKDGAWYDEQGVGINADVGIGIYGGEGLMGLRTYPTHQDYLDGTNVQCYVGTDGKIYGGGGAAWIDEEGVNIKGEHLLFKDGSGNNVATIRGYTGKILYIWLGDYETQSVDGTLHINCKDIVCELYSGYSMRPFYNGVGTLGTIDKQWKGGYFKDRLKIPVGVDCYD